MKHISLTNFIVFLVLFVCPTFVYGQGESADLVNETVYINHVDSKFHREYCKKLVFTKRPIKVSDALSKKYTPCDVCNASTRYKDLEKVISEKPNQDEIIFRDEVDLSRPDLPKYCPYQYFNDPLPVFADFESLNKLIKKHGKIAVFRTTYKLSGSLVTIRVGDEFRQVFGAPDPKYVDECSIMYDLINLRLSPKDIEEIVVHS